MMWCSATDFPTPLLPSMQTVSPGMTLKLTSSSTTLSPKAFETCSNSMYGLPLLMSALWQRHRLLLQHGHVFLRSVHVGEYLGRKTSRANFVFVDYTHRRVTKERHHFVLLP